MSNPRLADLLLSDSAIPLGNLSYRTDPSPVERLGTRIRFYHYTRPEHLAAILAPDGGLRPRRTTPHPPDSGTPYVLEGLLTPSPPWMTGSPYFGDLGLELFQQYVGTVPLAVTLPEDFPGLWVFDYAFAMECKAATRHGHAPLGLGFDCANGRECVLAMARSRIPLATYQGGHIAPIIECFASTTGIAIPSRYITIA
ncbi:MAG: hypothetical protein QM589_14750 [Thermomicrobiales bacterium]